MRVRREQGLLVVVVVLAAWIWFGRDTSATTVRVNPSPLEYEPAALPVSPLLASGTAAGRDDPFREPSESAPLPPRPLPEPPLSPLPVVMLPLPLGQQASAYGQLRAPGAVAEPVSFDEPDDGGDPEAVDVEVTTSNNGSSGGAAPASLQGGGSAQWERVWDRLEDANGQVIWGECLNPNKHALARGVPDQVIEFRAVNVRTGAPTFTLKKQPNEVRSLTLAKNLRNEIAFRELELSEEVADLPNRAAMVDWLLDRARDEPWVYAEAEKHARVYARLDPDPVAGNRLLARMLRAAGRIGDELELYRSLEKQLGDSPFCAVGIGRIEALLGLDAAAEQRLRQAAERSVGQPWAPLALARFLLDRGRAAEALPHAQTAYRQRGVSGRADEQREIQETLLAVLLALGRLDEARPVVAGLPDAALAAKGAAAYAAGEVEFAASQFRAALEADLDPGLASLGIGACLLRQGQWKDAVAALEAVADQYPEYRARALCGIGLAYERTGNLDRAKARLGDALVVDPTDGYALYLQGRVLRLLGEYEAAADQLDAALRRRDDLAEALAESAEVYLRRAESDAAAIDSLVKAVRYADRCVTVDGKHHADGQPTVRYLELQGLARYRAGYLRLARDAFDAASTRGSTLGQVGMALVDYAQNRVEAARDQLADLDKRPLGDPFRDYGRATLALIDDHAEKVEIRDDFDRAELGNRWDKEFRGRALQPRLAAGKVEVSGRLEQAVALRRTVDQAGDFLAAEVDLERGAGDRSDFAGLHLVAGREGRGADFEAWLGYADLEAGMRPALRIMDGDESRAVDATAKARFEWRPLEVDASASPARLVLEFVPESGVGDKAFVLRALWNGQLVVSERIERVSRSSRTPLYAELLVTGRRADVDARFDSFRLRLRQVAR